MRRFISLVILVASATVWADDQTASTPKLIDAQALPIQIEAAALQRQHDALQAMRLQILEYSPLGPVHNIDGDTGVVLPSAAVNLKKGDSGSEILNLFKDVLLATGNETLTVTRNNLVDPKTGALRLSQSIRGIPVIHGGVSIEYDGATKRVSGVTAAFIPDRGLPREPKLSAKQAEEILAQSLTDANGGRAVEIEIVEGTYLGYYAVPAVATPPALVWVIAVLYRGGMDEIFYVNAVTGTVLDRQQRSKTLTRVMYNANFSSPTIPSGLPDPMTPDQIANNPDASEAKADVLDADTILRQRLSGYVTTQFPTTTRQTVRYLFSSPNATHLQIGSSDYITYSGTTTTTISATTPEDITFHEYAHGIADRTFGFSGDSIENQHGSLHEAFGDFAATVVDVGLRGGIPVTATWKLGEGWYLAAPTSAIRSFANPSASYPSASGDWFPIRALGSNNSHYNSTILSHAYYLAIYGGLHSRSAAPEVPEINVPSLELLSPALAEDKARRIFARAFNDTSMDFQPTFIKMKTAAMSAALTLFNSAARTSIQKAFEAVGIGYGCSVAPATSPDVDIGDLLCAGRFNTTWPAMANANRYYAQAAPAQLGFAFAVPVSDVQTNHCLIQVGQPSVYRIRACNNCGCGPWSDTEYLPYWSPCP